LDCGWNPRLLLIHSRSTLSACSLRSLCIQALLVVVMARIHLWILLGHHTHLRCVICRVRWVRGRSALLMSRVHSIVHGWRLRLRIWAHLHGVRGLGHSLGLDLCLCGLSMGLSLCGLGSSLLA
jgi:hypothetical protein